MADKTRLNRRSFVGRVFGAGALLGGVALLTPAAAQVTDQDAGATADPGGRGRGARRTTATGVTDRDAGATADPGGYGRNPGGPLRTGVTDTDSGPSADRGGFGRGGARMTAPSPPPVQPAPMPPVQTETLPAMQCTGATLPNGITCQPGPNATTVFSGGSLSAGGNSYPVEYYEIQRIDGQMRRLEIGQGYAFTSHERIGGLVTVRGCNSSTFVAPVCGRGADVLPAGAPVPRLPSRQN